MSSSVIQVRIDAKLKKHAESLFLGMGLKTPEAIRMFLQQAVNEQALPFRPHVSKIPNQSTIESFNEIKQGKYITSSLDDFKKSLKA